ncbi:zinc-dependent metalloprotease [Brevibacterium sp. 50QC2O2]|uniref:zinc-dependent metalloprotease n=1 Tax=Brevibacterium TaxID=1696 RepID=UPI00211C38B3|nr:zinc-dependent metalloprotease [Brevibacterium sp. 68QC2CO]MCQ9387291.1 zinc-dependent metalloprotease [Brevibacterium sp. 50QC2O2]
MRSHKGGEDRLHPALRTVRELTPAGPRLSRYATRALVADLRNAAQTAPDLVLGVMRLAPGADTRARRALAGQGPALVVDRLGWAKANIEATAGLGGLLAAVGTERGLDDLVQAGRTLAQDPVAHPRLQGLDDLGAAAELGAALSVLAPRVLGQYLPFGSRGHLLLVAPNVAANEQRLQVVPRDFRLWVALHESTHQVQFAAAPWLREYLEGLIVELAVSAEDESPGVLDTIRAVVRTITGHGSLLDIVSTPAQREKLERITAIMSLLEGHADVVMDAVGPRVIPSVAQIRARFDTRRDDSGAGFGAIVARALGLAEKMEQYRSGARFVRGVTGRVGHAGLAAVWESPQALPSPSEIAAPGEWVARVLG